MNRIFLSRGAAVGPVGTAPAAAPAGTVHVVRTGATAPILRDRFANDLLPDLLIRFGLLLGSSPGRDGDERQQDQAYKTPSRRCDGPSITHVFSSSIELCRSPEPL